MVSINNIEDKIEGWLKPVPHLPATWRKWIAENAWWLTLIGVIVSALGILLSSPFAVLTSYYGIFMAHTGWWIFVTFISLAFTAVTTVISAVAISPLKSLKKAGWRLLFYAYAVGILAQVVNMVLNLNVYSFIPSLLGIAISAAIGAYVLFEIRSNFNLAKVVSKKK